MCRKATCRTCSKVTWAGCGAHVDQVLAGVPRADQCRCTAADHAAAKAAGGGSFFQRLFGR